MTPIQGDFFAQPQSLRTTLAASRRSGIRLFRNAARLINKAKRIVISGMGGSCHVAEALRHGLCQRGLGAHLISSAELIHYLTPLCDDAVVVLISRSGESVEVVKLLEAINGKATSIIAVTNEPNSTLGRSADVTLLTHCPTDQYVAIQTYSTTMLILSLLESLCTGREFDAAADELDAILSSDWAAWLLDCDRRVQNSKAAFEGIHSLYLLARGASIGSAEEGALLFHETAKLSAVSMEAGQFRHGPVEAVNRKTLAVVFAPGDSTQKLNQSLANDLVQIGGRVFAIGPLSQYADQVIHWPAQGSHPFEIAFRELVYLQSAAIHTAEWRGIEPGVFHFAPQVTTSETGFMKNQA